MKAEGTRNSVGAVFMCLCIGTCPLFGYKDMILMFSGRCDFVLSGAISRSMRQPFCECRLRGGFQNLCAACKFSCVCSILFLTYLMRSRQFV